MIVFPVRPIMPVAKVVRSAESAKSEEAETEQPAAGLAPIRGRPARREGRSFYKSPNERSSPAVQDALLDLPRSG